MERKVEGSLHFGLNGCSATPIQNSAASTAISTKVLFLRAREDPRASAHSLQLSVSPIRLRVVTLPGLPPSSCGLVELMTLAKSTRFLPSRCQTSRLTMLIVGQCVLLGVKQIEYGRFIPCGLGSQSN